MYSHLSSHFHAFLGTLLLTFKVSRYVSSPSLAKNNVPQYILLPHNLQGPVANIRFVQHSATLPSLTSEMAPKGCTFN